MAEKINDVRSFVKKSLQSYYQYQQYKMCNDANINDPKQVIKINENSSVFINGIGGYAGDGNITNETKDIAFFINNSNVTKDDSTVSSVTVWSSQKTVDTINASLENYYTKSNIDIISSSVNKLDASIKDLSIGLNTTNYNLNNVSTRLNDVSTRLNNVSTRLNDTNTNLNNVSTRLNDVSSHLNDVSNRLYNTNTKLDNVSTKLDSFKAGNNIQIIDGAISALGYSYNLLGKNGFAIGDTYANNVGAFSVGYQNNSNNRDRITADGTASFVNGYSDNDNSYITATGIGAHAEGNASYGSISAEGNGAHAEGFIISTNGYIGSIIASGHGSHAEGWAFNGSIIASGHGSHAEGTNTYATGNYSHAEGYNSTASGTYSHAEGLTTNASGTASHAEGWNTHATGWYSHAEGRGTTASGMHSHASGRYTIADQENQFVCGKYNKTNNIGSLFAVGSGTNSFESSRRDAFTVKSDSITGVVNNIDNVIIGEPIGTMVVWSGSTNSYPPSGWLMCKGQAIITRTNGTDMYSTTIGTYSDYQNLLDIMQTSYGCGNTGTVFTVKNESWTNWSGYSFVRIPNATVSFGGVTKQYIIKYQ